jgi:hypothetical protein
MNAVGKIPRKGMIREDTWIKDFTKDMLVKVANSEEMQLRDLHADMDRQITRTYQLRLVDCCYDSHVMTNRSTMATLNVVTGYTLLSQIGSRGSDSRGIMISLGFVKAMSATLYTIMAKQAVSAVSRTKHLLLIEIPGWTPWLTSE